MKHLQVLIFLLIISLQQHAQPRTLDSLDQLISKAKTDTGRINLLIVKVGIVNKSNLDSAIILGGQALKEAQKAKYYQGEIDLRQSLTTNYCFKGNYKAAQEHLDYMRKFIKPGDSLNLAYVYSNYGMLYGMQSKYDSSASFYEIAIGIEERKKDSPSLANSYTNLAISYQQLGNYPQALQYQQKALRIAEIKNNEISQAYTLTNMGITYENYGDTLKAEQTYLKAAELGKKHELRNVELYVYSNLSTLYVREKRWEKGYDFAVKAADLAALFGDQGIQAASLSKAATARANQNRFSEGTALAKTAIQLADSSGQPLNKSQAYVAMANLLFLQNKYKDAIPFYEKNFEALKGVDIYVEGNSITYKELSRCYEETGNFVKALQNYKLGADIADSIRSKENIRKATELSMNYEFNKKQEALAAEKKRQDELARTRQIALLVGLVSALILALVAFNGYRNKRKANALLTEQKQKIESTLDELKSTQKQLIQSEKMASLGELTAGIAHEIQNPLNFVNNFAELNGELADELQTALASDNKEDALDIVHDIKQNAEKIAHHGKRADSIVKGMLQHSRVSSDQKESTDINNLVDEYVRLSYHGMRAKDKLFNVKMETDLKPGLPKISVTPQDIGRVLLNMINNSFYAVNDKKKKSGEGYEPVVKISTDIQNGKVIIKVADNGPGISQAIADKIFQPFFTTKPTGQGTGLGLSLSYDIIKAHNGTIQVETGEEESTTFIILLPVR